MIDDLIEQLQAHGTAHGNWQLCFTQLASTLRDLVAAQLEQVVQLTARLDHEQEAIKVQTRLRALAEGRVQHLEALLVARDQQILVLQEAGGTVLQELLRLRAQHSGS